MWCNLTHLPVGLEKIHNSWCQVMVMHEQQAYLKTMQRQKVTHSRRLSPIICSQTPYVNSVFYLSCILASMPFSLWVLKQFEEWMRWRVVECILPPTGTKAPPVFSHDHQFTWQSLKLQRTVFYFISLFLFVPLFYFFLFFDKFLLILSPGSRHIWRNHDGFVCFTNFIAIYYCVIYEKVDFTVCLSGGEDL